jgi:ribosomal protein S27AE
MAKSDFICGICKRVAGSDGRGRPTSKYRCSKHKEICRDCVSVSGGFLSRTRRECRKCGSEVLLYEFNEKRNRWEKA